MKLIKLSKVLDDRGEDDGAANAPQIVPVAVAVNEIANFHSRRPPLVGTRIIMHNGKVVVVSETFDAVYAAATTTE